MVFFHKAAVALLLSLILMLSFSACAETQSNELEPQSSSQAEHLSEQSSEQSIKKPSKEDKNTSSEPQDTFVLERKMNTNDLITPFVYTLPGDQLSDEQIKSGFQSLYNSAHDVFYWYYNDSGPLNTNFEVPKIEDKQGDAWYPVTRLKTLDELYEITESVFSKRFSNYALYRLRRFHDIDGKLYERAGGGFGDSTTPDFNSIEILSKTPQVITLYINLIRESFLTIAKSYGFNPPYTIKHYTSAVIYASKYNEKADSK